MNTPEPPPFAIADNPGSSPIGRPQSESGWGLRHIFFGLPFVPVLVLQPILLLVQVFQGKWSDEELASEQFDTPVLALAIVLVVQQSLMIAWPLIVSRWKGNGPVQDWGLKFKSYDPAIAVGLLMVAFPVLSLITFLLGKLVGLESQDSSSNSQFLTDAQDSPWLFLLIFCVVIGAPFSEELYFRGFVQNIFSKRFGLIWGVATSTFLFTVIHGAENLKGTVVLFGAIGTLGLLLGLVTGYTKRLGAAISAHIMFNVVGVLAALEFFDFLTPTN